MRKFEIAMCEARLIGLGRTLEKMNKGPVNESSKKIIAALEKERKDYMKRIIKIKEKVD